ncbi:MAG: OmpA family protein [Deltaproteobacteria bacterium]|nr:OmpA family protein [Deltaproteobacteria bacterium]
MNKHFYSCAFLVGVLAALGATPATTQAQGGFTLSRYRLPPNADEGFGVLSPAPPPHLRLDMRLGIDYSYGQLALSTTTADGRTRDGYLVENSFTTHLAASMGLYDWLGVWVGIPVTWAQGGADPADLGLPMLAAPAGPAAGDMAIGVRAIFLGSRQRPTDGAEFSLGAAASLLLPTGVQESLTGDGGVGFRLLVSAALGTAMVTPIANVGIAYRPDGDYQGIAQSGSELLFALGAHVHLDPVRIEAELRGATTLTTDQVFSGDAVPIEVLVGAHLALGSGLTAGLAVDAGVTEGVGVPAVRILGTFGFALSLADLGDENDDDDDDEAANVDPDGDGILGARDECPEDAEDADGHADDDLDEDGCPDGVEITEDGLATTAPITFGHRDAELTDEATSLLNVLARALQDHQEVVLVQVEGHAAANEGGTNRRLALSGRRAEAVTAYLVERGVRQGRLTFVGMGSDVPAEAGEHDKNRRVSFRVLERR